MHGSERACLQCRYLGIIKQIHLCFAGSLSLQAKNGAAVFLGQQGPISVVSACRHPPEQEDEPAGLPDTLQLARPEWAAWANTPFIPSSHLVRPPQSRSPASAPGSFIKGNSSSRASRWPSKGALWPLAVGANTNNSSSVTHVLFKKGEGCPGRRVASVQAVGGGPERRRLWFSSFLPPLLLRGLWPRQRSG